MFLIEEEGDVRILVSNGDGGVREVALHAGEAATPGPYAWLVGAYDGGVSILPCTDAERSFFERACTAAQPVKGSKVDAAWLKEALAAGVLAWRPR